MTQSRILNLRLLLILIVSCCLLLLASVAHAQSASPKAVSSPNLAIHQLAPSPSGNPSTSPNPSGNPDDAKGVTFPIKELGNCENKGACLNYCDDPVNYSSCVDYAKTKGFYVPDKLQSEDSKFWDKSKTDLGCNDKDSCSDFCAKEENKATCDKFSKNEGLIGGYVQEPDQPQFIDQAKKELGCDSAESCGSFCDKPENSKKCSDFAHSVGLLGGEVIQGPGGCTTDGTCKNFCSDPNNFNKCQPYAPPNTQFQGPGGCDNPQSCRSHCEQNPSECRSYSPGSNGQYVPISCP